MQSNTRIFLAGHRGMVGSAIDRVLVQKGYTQIIKRTRSELDLTHTQEVDEFYEKEKPEVVIMAAAKVGGILANQNHPAEFLYENSVLQTNIIHGAFTHGVSRLVFLGSSCIYPKHAHQPIHEKSILSGSLEPTNEGYALAKIAGLKLCEFYRRQYGVLFHSVMPVNLYGPGDNYNTKDSHVLAAFIRRFHEAKISNAKNVTIWGTGQPRREFLHVDDLATAIYKVLEIENPPDWVNVGYGKDLTVLELAQLISKIVGFKGTIDFDRSKPDGTPRKLLDNRLIRELGWEPQIHLEEGIRLTYEDYLKNLSSKTLRQ
jgi:GDP-L-fucose synthase